jgi:glycerophosphoryl diester phosphodiesterase
MIYNCLQQKGLRRKEIRQIYKVQRNNCKSSFLCKAKVFLSYFLKNIWNWIRFIFCFLIGFFKLLPIWLYEMFRFCPLKQVKTNKESFLIIGHRGAAAYEIENTIPAMDKAINKYKANALEIDLSITKDNEIILWHDWNPDEIVAVIRQMGFEPHVKYRPFVPMSGMWRKPVNKLLLSELHEHYGYAIKKGYPTNLNAHIPTLKEFLEFAKNQPELKTVLLDIKIPVEDIDIVALFSHLLTNIIEEYSPHFKIVILSPEEQIINTFKRYLPDEFYSFDVELPMGIILDPEYFSSVNKAIKLKNNYSSIGRPMVLHLAPWTTYRRIIQYDVKKRQEYNHNNPEILVEQIISWTINNTREMKCLLKMGVDGILTDKPDKLNKILKKK